MSDLGEISLCYTLTFTRHTSHSAERVWRALTDPAEVSAWMDYPARVDLRPGGNWFIDFARTEDGELPGVIIRVEEGRTLAYAWGRSVIEWSIVPSGSGSGSGCTYTFVHQGIVREYTEGEEGFAAGWHGFLTQLEHHLDGLALDREANEADWKALHPAYRQRLDSAYPPRHSSN